MLSNAYICTMKCRYILSVGIFFMFSCNYYSVNTENNNTSHVKTGKVIYQNECMMCHGENGKKRVLGAGDLSQSVLTISERIEIITYGKKSMPSFEQRLKSEQIREVAEYLESLKPHD